MVKVVSIVIIKNLRRNLCDQSKRKNKNSLQTVSNPRRANDSAQTIPLGQPQWPLRNSKVALLNDAICDALAGWLLSKKKRKTKKLKSESQEKGQKVQKLQLVKKIRKLEFVIIFPLKRQGVSVKKLKPSGLQTRPTGCGCDCGHGKQCGYSCGCGAGNKNID